MKKWIGLMALVTAASSVSAAQTGLYEPFSQAVGSSLDNLPGANGNAWAYVGGTGTTSKSTITAGDMVSSAPGGATISSDYAALPAPQGNYLVWNQNSNHGYADRIDIGHYIRPGSDPSGAITLYYSMEFRDDAIGNLTAGGWFIAGFTNTAGTGTSITNAEGRLYLRVDPTTSSMFDFGINTQTSGTGTVWSGGESVGQDFFVVVSQTLNVGTSSDVANLWIDPDMSTFGTASQPAPTMTVTGDGMPNNGWTVQSLFLRTGSMGDTSMDEMRIGTSWAGVTALEWKSTGDSSWSTAGNWSNSAAPSAIGADVTFGANSSQQAISLDEPVTAGILRFNSANSYTIAGPNTLTIDQPTIPSPSYQTHGQIIISADSSGNAGNVTISAPVQLNKPTDFTVPTGSTLTLSGGMSATAGVAFSVSGGGNAVIAPASHTSLQGLTGITVAGSKLQFTPNHAAIMTTGFNLDSTSTLDLTNNDMIVDYAPNAGNPTGTDATTGPAVVAAVLAANDGGLWDKPGITTSLAPAGSGKTLAVVDNETLATPLASADGVTLDSSLVVVKYTWFGDLNLDGVVDGTDLSLMGTLNSTTSTPNWASGDLNYDGTINADDWALFQLGAAQSNGANISVTPEPSAALAMAGIGLLAARRRRASAK